MNNQDYPGVSVRVKALIMDTIVLLIFMTLATFIFSKLSDVPDKARFFVFVFIFLLYDPLFTSFLGGTLGHFVMGIRIRNHKDEQKNLILPLAIVRFIFKTALGWISLLTVMGSDKGKAIHDMIAQSVVVYNKKEI